MTQIIKNTKKYWSAWVKRRRSLGNPLILDSNNIYILPSGFGWIFGFVLFTLLIGATNYQISTVFLMTFLLAVTGLLSAWEAHSNLQGLSIRLISVEDTQQGRPAQLILFVQSNTKPCFGLEFQLNKQAKIRIEKIPVEGMQFILPIKTPKRGYFPLPAIIISSLYPFGIFRVWSYAFFEQHYYVFPQPVSPGFWPTPLESQKNKKKEVTGEEELYELKQVEDPWSQPKMIAWKIAAKGQGWFLKTMDSTQGDYWLFKLTDLQEGDVENKLEYLSFWLQTAELNHQVYGVQLGKSSVPLGQGEEHLQHCLRQLALY